MRVRDSNRKIILPLTTNGRKTATPKKSVNSMVEVLWSYSFFGSSWQFFFMYGTDVLTYSDRFHISYPVCYWAFSEAQHFYTYTAIIKTRYNERIEYRSVTLSSSFWQQRFLMFFPNLAIPKDRLSSISLFFIGIFQYPCHAWKEFAFQISSQDELKWGYFSPTSHSIQTTPWERLSRQCFFCWPVDNEEVFCLCVKTKKIYK